MRIEHLVLILVLMEDALREIARLNPAIESRCVLILVLMEDALRDATAEQAETLRNMS